MLAKMLNKANKLSDMSIILIILSSVDQIHRKKYVSKLQHCKSIPSQINHYQLQQTIYCSRV